MANEVIVVTPLEILVVAAPAIVLGYLGNSRLGTRRAIIGCIIFVCLWFLSLTPTLDKAVTVLLVVALGFCSGLFFPLAKRKAPSGPIRFRYCPNCSSRLESRQIDGNMLDACPSCDFVHWNNPITVGVIVIPSGDGIVLVKRGNPPKKGMWALPGGFGNPNECPHNTAVREALEETSLVVEIDRCRRCPERIGAGSARSPSAVCRSRQSVDVRRKPRRWSIRADPMTYTDKRRCSEPTGC